MAIEGINGAGAPLLPLYNNNPPGGNLLNRFQNSTCSGKTFLTISCVGCLASSALIVYGITALAKHNIGAGPGGFIIGIGAFFIVGLACMCALSMWHSHN